VSVDVARQVVTLFHPRIIAFGDRDFRSEIVAVAKDAHAEVYVDRLGATDGPDGWRAAVEAGADGIQTDHADVLLRFLRTSGRHD